MPGLDTLSENKLFEIYGVPKTGPVTRADGGSLRSGVPDYLVRSASFPASGFNLEGSSVKLIDFGESFLSYEKPKALHTPLALRAPEVLFDEEYDFRVDCWSFACAVGRNHAIFLDTLLTRMLDIRIDCRLSTFYWHHGEKGKSTTTNSGHDRSTARKVAGEVEGDAKVESVHSTSFETTEQYLTWTDQVYDEDPVYDLEQWLDLTYFDDGKRIDFTREDIKQVGRMIRGLSQWCPSDRSSVTEVLANEWFRDC